MTESVPARVNLSRFAARLESMLPGAIVLCGFALGASFVVLGVLRSAMLPHIIGLACGTAILGFTIMLATRIAKRPHFWSEHNEVAISRLASRLRKETPEADMGEVQYLTSGH